MHPARRARSARRLPYLAFVIVVGLSALVLSQCKLVNEPLTEVADQFKAHPDKCIEKCSQKADRELDKESDRHAREIAKCNGEPSCLSKEEIRHEQALQQIERDRNECVNGCHHQGGGQGGR